MNTVNIVNVLMAADGIKPFGERIADGLQVFVIGVLAVFSVLACLWGVLGLFKIFFYDIPEKRKAALTQKIHTDAAPAPAVEAAPAEAVAAEDDTQLIAVITAAIAAYNADCGKKALPFRVVSYKRVRGANGWNGADENETV